MRVSFRAVLLFALAASGVSPAIAAVETYSFAGYIDRIFTSTNGSPISYIGSSNIEGKSFATGGAITGTFSYDSAAPVYSSSTNSSGDKFTFYPALISLSIKTGNLAYTIPSVSNLVTVGNFQSSLATGALFSGSTWTPLVYQSASVWVYNSNGKFTGSTNLPSSMSLTDFNYSTVSYAYIDSTTKVQTQIAANVTNLIQLKPVPEPKAYAILLAGMTVVGWTVRRRKK